MDIQAEATVDSGSVFSNVIRSACSALSKLASMLTTGPSQGETYWHKVKTLTIQLKAEDSATPVTLSRQQGISPEDGMGHDRAGTT